MSILQDYERIRESIGYEKFDAIDEYLKEICKQENIDKYYKEVNKIDASISNYNDEMIKLKSKYNVIFLDDVLYKNNEWENFNIWYSEKYLHNKIEILDVWTTDNDDDIRCNAILSKNGKRVANIIVDSDEPELRYLIGNKDSDMNEEFVRKAFKSMINNDFDFYLDLPKISDVSKLLKEIYDIVCESDSDMCYITEEDWNDDYSDVYTDEDFENLKLEIKKLGLENVISINDGEYKILGYTDLQTKFNDNRNLRNYIIKNMYIVSTGGNVFNYYGELESGEWYLHSDLSDSIVIYDKNPFSKDNDDSLEWHEQHLIEELDNSSSKDLFKKMDSLVNNIEKEPFYNKLYHEHLNNMIEQKDMDKESNIESEDDLNFKDEFNQNLLELQNKFQESISLCEIASKGSDDEITEAVINLIDAKNKYLNERERVLKKYNINISTWEEKENLGIHYEISCKNDGKILYDGYNYVEKPNKYTKNYLLKDVLDSDITNRFNINDVSKEVKYFVDQVLATETEGAYRIYEDDLIDAWDIDENDLVKKIETIEKELKCLNLENYVDINFLDTYPKRLDYIDVDDSIIVEFNFANSNSKENERVEENEL